jgi:DNA-directed RNA polymerase subunit RPC12/RpoP
MNSLDTLRPGGVIRPFGSCPPVMYAIVPTPGGGAFRIKSLPTDGRHLSPEAIMLETLLKCDRCGADAALKFTEGVLVPDLKKPNIRVIQIIECPYCGLREQPVTLARH